MKKWIILLLALILMSVAVSAFSESQDMPFEPSPHAMDAGLNQLFVVHEGELILIAVTGDHVGESQDPAAQALIQLWQKAIQAFEDLQ